MDINLTLLVELVFFAIFLYFVRLYLWPEFIRALDERRQLVDEGLRKADEAKVLLQEAQAQVQLMLKDASKQSKVILEESKSEASLVIEKAKKTSKLITDQAYEQGKRDAEALKQQALDGAKSELLKLCEVVLTKVMLKTSTQSESSQLAMIEQYIQEVKVDDN